MTTITREHLELATKAAGYTGIDFSVVDAGGNAWRVSGHLGVPWQPHKDPTDTWQLAADCRLNIDFDNERVFYPDEDDMYAGIWFCKAWHCTAMEAVTLAAAEIGRAMG